MLEIFSSDSKVFVGLNAEAPLRVLQAVLDRASCIGHNVRSIHRLEQEFIEREMRKSLRRRVFLRIYQLEFIPFENHQLARGFRADANPVDSRRRRNRAVGFNCYLESAYVQGVSQFSIDLKQRLSAGQNAEAVTFAAGPFLFDRNCEIVGVLISATFSAIGTDEIGIAKCADSLASITFAAGPEIAPGETAEHGCSAGVRALAL
jgi:hypothetical protein